MTIPRNDVCLDMILFGDRVCRCTIVNALPSTMSHEAKLLIVGTLEDADDPEALWDAMVQGFEGGEPGQHRGITAEDLGLGGPTTADEDLVTITIGGVKVRQHEWS